MKVGDLVEFFLNCKLPHNDHDRHDHFVGLVLEVRPRNGVPHIVDVKILIDECDVWDSFLNLRRDKAEVVSEAR